MNRIKATSLNYENLGGNTDLGLIVDGLRSVDSLVLSVYNHKQGHVFESIRRKIGEMCAQIFKADLIKPLVQNQTIKEESQESEL